MTNTDYRALEAATDNRFEVVNVIGEGGMGKVYLARNRQLSSMVAIKVLPSEVRSSPNRLARFKREAALAAQLSHPHLVPAFEFGETEDIIYLVMPYIDGIPLDTELARRGKLPHDEVQVLIEQVGSALAFSHNRGIIHRDIKPANILLERETDRWLVTDFGVAHVVDADTTLTHTGDMLGTPVYMAPEQLTGAPGVDGRADLFALAAVAYEALAGERPETSIGVAAHGDNLSRACPELPSAYVHALVAPLAVARDERPPSVAAWLEMLARTVRPRRRAHWAAAAAIVLGVGAWAVFRPGVEIDTGPTVVAVMPFAVSGPLPSLDLDSVLPDAFTMQLQTLPGLEIVQPAAMRQVLRRRYGPGPFGIDSLRSMVAGIGADQALIGRVTAVGDTALEIGVEVYDVRRQIRIAGADTTGPADSLHAMVTGLVINSYATRLAQEQSGVVRPALPHGTPAVAAYFEGDRHFRRGRYREAVNAFDRVIASDSTYAPAYFKRMLATLFDVQPTQTGDAVRTALDAARRYRSRLDEASQRLIEGYAVLLDSGDVAQAEQIFEDVVNDHPDAIDAWFLLGLVRFRFATLVGSSIGEARAAFQQAVTRDPTFAAAVGNLAQIAILEQERITAREYLARYLQLDSTSTWAELARLADTLLYQQEHAARILSTFGTRSPRILEMIGLMAGELHQPGGTRPFSAEALEALWARAGTEAELKIAFRMRMALYLGAGQLDRAEDLLADARARGQPRAEMDRWVVLTWAVELPWRLGTAEEAAAAAERLRTTNDEPRMSAWLGARWARRTGTDPAPFDARLNALQEGDPTLVQQGLRADLAALDHLAAGDTAAALNTWRRTTERFAVDDVIFGFANSLWPPRLDYLRLALATGNPDAVRQTTATFERMAGFTDQVAWVPVLQAAARAALTHGDTAAAVTSYGQLRRLLSLADSSGLRLRDSVVAEMRRMEGG